MKKTPSFTLTTVILLGLGIGSVTTAFTLVDHMLLRPLPYPDAERLLVVDGGLHSGPTVREFMQMGSVDVWGIVLSDPANLGSEVEPLRIQRTEVSRQFFTLFGARPQVGRLFVEEDYVARGVAVLSPGLWQRAFGGDEDVVGQVIRVDGSPLSVVGVLGQDFVQPDAVFTFDGAADLWVPLDWGREDLKGLSYHGLSAAGRMTEGATIADVGVEIDRALEDLAQRYPRQYLDDEGRIKYGIAPVPLQDFTTRSVRAGLQLLVGAVALLLLVACMNVAHLFLARGLGRIQEMAVRRALGADTHKLVRQLMVESLVLGGAGGLLGLGLAALGLRFFVAFNPSALPRSGNLSLDLRILLFTGLVSVATALIFGLVPALRSVGEDLAGDLRRGPRSSTPGRGAIGMRSGLVVAEMALSLILLAGAGLLLKSFVRVRGQDPGMEVAGVWTLPLTPSFVSSPGEYVETMDRVEAALAAVPGVSEATYSFTLPFDLDHCCWMTSNAEVEGVHHEGFLVIIQPVTETFFATLGIPLSAGGVWGASGALVRPAPTVVSENLAVRLFGSAEEAVNGDVEIGGVPLRVFGVAGDTRHFGLDQDYPFFAYVPIEQVPFVVPQAHMAVKIRSDPPPSWARMLREAVWEAVPNMPVPVTRSMEEWVALSSASRRFDSALFGCLGGMALTLAAAGLYGTLSYSVGQRRRELAIRLALGADRGGVQGQVVFRGLVLAACGAVVGLGGVWATGRFLESRLHNLEPTDPLTLLCVAIALILVAAVSSWLPARRAARTDPLETLKAE